MSAVFAVLFGVLAGYLGIGWIVGVIYDDEPELAIPAWLPFAFLSFACLSIGFFIKAFS